MSHYRANPIKEGYFVEVINCGAGMEYSYYGATASFPVTRGRCKVRYTPLMKEDEENVPLEEEITLAMLRPFPEVIPHWEYRLGEIVDGWFNVGWWLGRIIAKLDGKYVIQYEDKSHHTHSFEDVRLLAPGVELWCLDARQTKF